MDVACDIDGPALPGSFLDVAVGSDNASGGQHAPWTTPGLETEGVVVGTFRTAAVLEFSKIGGGPRRYQIDDAADGARSIEIAGAATYQLNAFQRQLRLFLPANPTGEGIVEGHVVFGDQGAAGGGGTDR